MPTLCDGCPHFVVRSLQDRAIALLVEARLRDRCYDSEFKPLRHLIEPGTMFVIPHPLITQRGGFVPTDDTEFVNIATARTRIWDIRHVEITFFKEHGLTLHPEGVDVRDMLT